jgi:ABC-type transporter Mla subunit MlaD
MPDKKHNFTMTEVSAGLMVLVSGLVFFAFMFAILGSTPGDGMNAYQVYLADTQGLAPGADVRYGGAKRGQIAGIHIDEADQSRWILDIRLDPELTVNTACEAFVSQVTLTSPKHLEISTGTREAAVLEPGSAIPSRPGGLFAAAAATAASLNEFLERLTAALGVPDQSIPEAEREEFTTVAELMGKVGGVVDEGQGLVVDVRDVVGDNREHIDAILTKLQEVEDAAKGAVIELQEIVSENRENIRVSVAETRSLIENVGDVSTRLASLTDSLQGVLDNADGAVTGAGAAIDSARPQVEDILIELQETVRNINTFSRTLAEQPDAVIRGRQPQGRRSR